MHSEMYSAFLMLIITYKAYSEFPCNESVNPLPVKLSYLNFHPLEVVSRHRDTQL